MKRQLLAQVATGIVLTVGIVVNPGGAIAQSSVISMPPPQIYDYWISVTRQAGGILVFDGYAPDAATRERFSEIDGADISWLKLGSGAPSTYDAAATFGIEVLGRLTEGRFAVRGNIVSISGVAASSEDFLAARQLLASVPQGLILAMGEIAAPRVDPYGFSVERRADGQLVLSGYVPSPALEQALLEAAGDGATSILAYGSGQPFTFETSARQALSLIPLLAEGEIRLEGERWTIAGTPTSSQAARAIETRFAEQRLPEAGWGLSLTPPPPVSVAVTEAPVAAPTQEDGVVEQAVAEPSSDLPSPEEVERQPIVATPPQAAVPANPVASQAQQLTVCREELAALSAQNGILFRSGAAVLADDSGPILDALATTLRSCPDTDINVEGHTDSDGDADRNMALSVARAEAVSNALIARGVTSERLYVLGYGESQPIADNATAAGKTQNRRIVVSVREVSAP